MFVQATLTDGTKVVSEFRKLTKLRAYAQSILSGSKLFNAWKVVSNVHPVNGEQNVQRERALVNGKFIVSLQEVVPTTDSHNYDPSNFAPKAFSQRGERGTWTVPAGFEIAEHGVSIAAPGTVYPKHRDGRSFRDYIILRAAADGQDEVRYYLDGNNGRTLRPVSDEFYDDDDE